MDTDHCTALNGLLYVAVQISALNGVKVPKWSADDIAILHPFDFVVVSWRAIIPGKLIFETDFLERTFAVDFSVMSVMLGRKEKLPVRVHLCLACSSTVSSPLG